MDTSQVNKSPIDDVQIMEKEPDDGGITSRYRGTAADKRDMMVLGKTQVLRVSIIDKPHGRSS
jgi:choline transport protein